MAIKLAEQNGYMTSTRKGIAANGLELDGAYFVILKNGVINKASKESQVDGVNETVGSFSIDNETVLKKEVVYVPANAYRKYEVSIEGGDVKKTDEGMYFKLKTADTVDGTTADTAPANGQVELVKFISKDKSIFRIAEYI